MRPLALAVCLLCLSATAAAAAGSGSQARFHKPKLTYRDTSAYGPAVAEAVRLWNAAGTRVRLRPARKGKRPRIRITSRPRVFHEGQEVAGTGGGNSRQGRRSRGRVRLSLAILGDGTTATPLQINVAAHELGHALGLEHTMGVCDLMNPFAEAEARGCESPPGSYRCGPQLEDAQALQQLYRGTLAFPDGGGLCAIPTDPVEVLGPPAEITLGPYEPARLEVRNAGSRTWEPYDVSATYSDADGNRIPSPCYGEHMSMSMTEPEVAAGAIATFEIPTCGESGSRQTYRVRLVDERDPGRPLPFGPVHEFTVNVA